MYLPFSKVPGLTPVDTPSAFSAFEPVRGTTAGERELQMSAGISCNEGHSIVQGHNVTPHCNEMNSR